MQTEQAAQARSLPIVPIDPLQASDEVIAELAAQMLAARRERNPEYPQLPLEELVKELRHPPEGALKFGYWGIFQGPRLLARANAMVNLTEKDIPTVSATLYTRPEYRRMGLATRLLEPLREFARQHGKTVLLIEATDHLPGGAAFLAHIGAEAGLIGHVNRLDLHALDRERMQAWARQGEARAGGFQLQFFEGVPPDEWMDSYCKMMTHIMETQPSGTIQFPFQVITAPLVIAMFKMDEDAGRRFWTLAAVEQASRRIVGYTEVVFHPALPQLVYQGGTCVFTEFRNRGLGRWLKASMVLRLVEEVGLARWVITSNADVNASMLKINQEMGFQPAEANAFWQYRLP